MAKTRLMIERAGKIAKLAFKAHPHMLRHACGGMPWRTRGTTRGRYKPTLGTQHSAYGALHRDVADAV